MVPITEPCTYPLHKRQKFEPEWIIQDIERTSWCNVCKDMQAQRLATATRHVYKRPQKKPENSLSTFISSQRVKNFVSCTTRFANKYAPEGMGWCVFGLHYSVNSGTPPKQFCSGCTRNAYGYFRKRYNKSYLIHTKVEIQREVTYLRHERSKVKKELGDLRKALKKMRVIAADLDATGIETNGRLTILPIDVAANHNNMRGVG